MEEKIIIDLNELKMLNESLSLIRFGAKVKSMLYRMFAPSGTGFGQFYLRGNSGDVQTFAAVLASEKRYMDAFLKNGLNDPGVLRSRYALDKAVRNFEQQTGIKWPLK
tara:strand:- start:1821 stop:2144 length:324 start_codon:yes stop_codon:yes gene_type:complete